MKVINFWAGPGAGKSTIAAGLFSEMKMLGYNVELVTEYAKEITWEKHTNLLADQLYITAEQNRRILRLKGQVDYVITDSPILQGLLYTPKDYFPSFSALMRELFSSYDNINFYVQRGHSYQQAGRNQTLEESIEIDLEILRILNENKIIYSTVSKANSPIESCKSVLSQYGIG